MRAIAISAFGDPPTVMELPAPEPGPGEVLVRMQAAGLNPYDWKVADGAMRDFMPHGFPLILGLDGAGIVESVGAGVTDVAPGDEVYGQFARLAQGGGSYAEFAIASTIAPMPKGMIFSQAAGVPVASGTAYNSVELARVDAGQTVLIVGATGGVGQAAVQLASDTGATVIATAGPDMAQVMRELGAAETVDYRAGSVAEQVIQQHPDGVDVLLDFIQGPAELAAASQVLRPGGALVSIVGAADVEDLAQREIRATNLISPMSPELLGTLADLIDAGRLRVRIEHEIPLAEAPEALARSKSGGARGKTVIEVTK